MNKMLRMVLVLVAAPLFCLALIVGLSADQAPDTAAALLYVRTDGHDTHCDGTANISYTVSVSPTCALATIQKGVTTVDTGGTVIVRAGVYTENVSITQNLTLQGDGADTTTVDGDGSGRVFDIGGGLAVTLSGVTVRNGAVMGHVGGGIYVANNGTVGLVGCTIISNTANAAGGIFIGDGSTTVISNSIIISNTASDGSGGGIASYADALSVISSTVSNNTATSRGGGLWQACYEKEVSIIRSVFEGNAAENNGGGVYQAGMSELWGALSIESSSFISNSARSGGGVHYTYGTLTINETAFLSNSAEYVGGGLEAHAVTLTIASSTLRWNRATNTYAGGLMISGTATLTGVTIADNTSNLSGGGIYGRGAITLTNITVSSNTAETGAGITQDSGGSLTIIHSTIASNTAGSGAALETYGPVSVRNSILAHNNVNCATQSGGSITSQGYNLEYGDSCGLNATGDMTSTNPLLGPLADNGGATWTHALPDTSLALDAVPKASCGASTDQRGVGRPQGPACDIGAYELGQVTLSLTKSVDDNRPERGQLITFTVRIDNSGILSATSALVSDTLHLSLTLAAPVSLYPPQSGVILAQNQGDLPLLASGLTISDGTCVTLTVPVTVAAHAPDAIITNTAAITSTQVTTPQVGSVQINLQYYRQHLPLVLREY